MKTADFMEFLQNELRLAEASYEKRRARIADDVQKMEYYIAGDYGAAYASRIEEMTEAAQRIRVLHSIASAYGYYVEHGEIQLSVWED